MAFDPYTAGLSLGIGAVDLGLDWLAGEEEAQRQRDVANALTKGVDNAGGIYQDTFNTTQGMYQPTVDRGETAWNNMLQLEGQLDPDNFKMTDFGNYDGGFNYNKDVQDFLDPSMEYQLGRARDARQGSAAAAGGLLSGKTLLDLQRDAQGLASTDWANSYDRMVGDKAWQYQDFTNRFNSARNNIQDRYAKLQDSYTRQGGIYNAGQAALGNQIQNRQNFGGQQANLAIQQANVNAGKSGIQGPWSRTADLSGKMGSVINQGVNFGRGVYDQWGSGVSNDPQGDYYRSQTNAYTGGGNSYTGGQQ